MTLKNDTGIIFAPDTNNIMDAVLATAKVARYVDAIKVSWPLIMIKGSIEVFYPIRMAGGGMPIIADLKVADVPHMSHQIVEAAVVFANGITVHGMVGRDVVSECVKVAHKADADVWVVTEASNPGAEEFMMGVGEKIAKMAKEVGADGLVAPATRPDRITKYREIVGKSMQIMSPGVGAQDGHIGLAIQSGADFAVVGRSIYEAPDPTEAVIELRDTISEVRLIEHLHSKLIKDG